MSTETTAPAPEPQTPQTKFQLALSQIKAKVSAPPAATAAPAEQAEVAAEPAAAEEPAEAAETPADEAPAEAPEATQDEGDADLKIARAQKEYLKFQRQAHEAKKRAEAAEAKAKEYEALEGKDPKAILGLLKARGLKVEDLAKAYVDSPEDEPAAPAESPEVKALRERLEALENEKRQAEETRVHEQNVKYVADLLAKSAETYPALASFPRAPAEVVRRYRDHIEQHGEEPDINVILKDFNDAVYSDVDSILSSEHALKAYLTRPEVKTRALALLGAKPSAGPASGEGSKSVKATGGPTAIPSTAAADPGARKARPLTREDKFAAALSHLRKKG